MGGGGVGAMKGGRKNGLELAEWEGLPRQMVVSVR